MSERPIHGRIIALDVGNKRIGVAMCDPDRIIASGQPTLPAQPTDKAYAQLLQMIADNEVVEVVIGLPLTLRGEVGAQAKAVQAFSRGLEKRTKIPITLYDERFTSVEAERSLEAMGIKKSKHRDHVDELAAILILQDYMSSIAPPRPRYHDPEHDDWD